MYWKSPLRTNLPSNLPTLDTYLLKALSMSKQWTEFVLTTSPAEITSGWTDYPFTNYPDIASEAKATCAVQALASTFLFKIKCFKTYHSHRHPFFLKTRSFLQSLLDSNVTDHLPRQKQELLSFANANNWDWLSRVQDAKSNTSEQVVFGVL